MDFLDALTRLNVNRRGGRFSPHKPVMMLAVLDLALAGRIPDNRIRLDPPLLERYRTYWDVVAKQGDQPSPYLPFFHLRSEPFWHLQASSGNGGPVLDALRSVNGLAQARSLIEYACLDDAVWRALQDPNYVESAVATVITHWFPERREELEGIWIESKEVSQYEQLLGRQEPLPVRDSDDAEVPARGAAFRRLVLEAYDYRCAACGWRFMLEEWALVEAAHIVPFSDSRNDDPRNGMALSPTFHRLMDKRLISPGPDLRWHVASVVDPRFPDNHPLVEIEGTDLILPRDKRRHPDPDALEWRMNQLRT